METYQEKIMKLSEEGIIILYKRINENEAEIEREVTLEVSQLEADIGKCSICGNSPALLVDRKEKGTYWLCADCMFEKIVDNMRLEAEIERLREVLTRAHDFIIEPEYEDEDMLLGEIADALKSGEDDE